MSHKFLFQFFFFQIVSNNLFFKSFHEAINTKNKFLLEKVQFSLGVTSLESFGRILSPLTISNFTHNSA